MVNVKVKGQVANVYGNVCTWTIKVYGNVCLHIRSIYGEVLRYVTRLVTMALVPRFFQKLARPLSRTVGQARVFAASYHEKVRCAVPVSTSAQAGNG